MKSALLLLCLSLCLATGCKSTPRANQPHTDLPTSYTVAPGDTLASISKKFYGTSDDWQHIYNANRGKLSTPAALRTGLVIQIPKLPDLD